EAKSDNALDADCWLVLSLLIKRLFRRGVRGKLPCCSWCHSGFSSQYYAELSM
ncbi:3570_t:CDS:2, partial [Scutellospora calospora]